MRNAESIAAINHEQLVTATDWLLARSGKREVAPVRGSAPRMFSAAWAHEAPTVRAAHPYLVPSHRLAHGSQPGIVLSRRAHATLVHSQLARRASAELYVGAALVAHAHVGTSRQHHTPAHVARVSQNLPAVAPYAATTVVAPYAAPVVVARVLPGTPPPRAPLPSLADARSLLAPTQLAPLSVPAHLAPPAVLAHLEAAPSPRGYVGRAPVASRATRTQAYRSPVPSARTREAAEQTLFVRAVRPRAFPATIVLTMLVGILAGLVAML